jgi:hypothetical protein
MSDDLLKLAVDAHGGAQRWEQIAVIPVGSISARRYSAVALLS